MQQCANHCKYDHLAQSTVINLLNLLVLLERTIIMA